MAIDGGIVVSAVSGFAAITAALWLGIKQIRISGRQVEIAERQAEISGEQNSISQRQTTIMELQSKMEHFLAMRDDLTEIIAFEDFLQNLKVSIIRQNWSYLKKTAEYRERYEFKLARIFESSVMTKLRKILDTSEMLYETRRMNSQKLDYHLFWEKSYSNEDIFKPIPINLSPRLSIIVQTVKEIDNTISIVEEVRVNIYRSVYSEYNVY